MVTTRALSLFDNFNQLTPYAVGFDRVFEQLNRYVGDVDNHATSTGFPPYNIRKEGDYNYVIEMALAGFGKDDIEVEVADSTMTIRSLKKPLNEDIATNEDTVYRGISYRKFQRKFTLAEDIVAKGAKLENGMLQVDLERVVPEEKKPRTITIK